MNPALLATLSAPRRRAPKADPLKAIGYIRCSTNRQDASPATQRAAMQRWCKEHGVQLVAVHEDIGASGGSRDGDLLPSLDRRPGLLAALDQLRADGAGVLLVAKRDRLARDTMASAMIERLAARHGATIASAAGEGTGDGPEHELMRKMVDAFAEYERAIIRGRIKAAMAAKRSRGELLGTAPYGQRLSADGVHLEQHPEEQRVIRTVRRLAANGNALRAIAGKLEAKGCTPRGGGRWHPQTVANILAQAK